MNDERCLIDGVCHFSNRDACWSMRLWQLNETVDYWNIVYDKKNRPFKFISINCCQSMRNTIFMRMENAVISHRKTFDELSMLYFAENVSNLFDV